MMKFTKTEKGAACGEEKKNKIPFQFDILLRGCPPLVFTRWGSSGGPARKKKTEKSSQACGLGCWEN